MRAAHRIAVVKTLSGTAVTLTARHRHPTRPLSVRFTPMSARPLSVSVRSLFDLHESPASARAIFADTFGSSVAREPRSSFRPPALEASSEQHSASSTSAATGQTATVPQPPTTIHPPPTGQTFSAEDCERYVAAVRRHKQCIAQSQQLAKMLYMIQSLSREEEAALHHAWKWVWSFRTAMLMGSLVCTALLMVEWRMLLYRTALYSIQYADYTAALMQSMEQQKSGGPGQKGGGRGPTRVKID